MLSTVFLLQTIERAMKTSAQSLLLYIGAEQFNVLQFSWSEALGFALGGAILSVLTSIVSSKVGDNDTPSLI